MDCNQYAYMAGSIQSETVISEAKVNTPDPDLLICTAVLLASSLVCGMASVHCMGRQWMQVLTHRCSAPSYLVAYLDADHSVTIWL